MNIFWLNNFQNKMCLKKMELNRFLTQFQNSFTFIIKTKKKSFINLVSLKKKHSNYHHHHDNPHATATIAFTVTIPSLPHCRHHYNHHHYDLHHSIATATAPHFCRLHRHCCRHCHYSTYATTHSFKSRTGNWPSQGIGSLARTMVEPLIDPHEPIFIKKKLKFYN